MNMSFSIAELGAIVHAMQEVYQSNSEENALCLKIIDKVETYLDSQPVDGLFDEWVREFDVIE